MALETLENVVDYKADPNVIPIGSQLSIPFKFLVDEAITVTFSEIDGSNQIAWVFAQDYNLVGAGDDEGGTLETLSVIPFGFKITIVREEEFTQKLVYPQDGKFPSESHERGLDKLTMLCQQLLASLEGGFKFSLPVLLANPNLNLDLPAPEANLFLGWDENAENIVNLQGPQIPQSVLDRQHFDVITPTNVLTVTEFEIDNPDELLLFVKQAGGSQFRELLIDEYSVASNVITLTTTLQSGASADAFRIRALNKGGRQFHRDLADPDRQVFDIFTYSDKNDIAVYIDGIYQPPETWTRSGGAQITFDELIPQGIPVDVNERLGTKGETGDQGPAGDGDGDVIGPDGGVSDNEIALYDQATGKLIKGSQGAMIDGAGNLTTTGNVQGRDIAADGTKLDTIQAGAQVNIITPAQAAELTGGGDTSLHGHADAGDVFGPAAAVTNNAVARWDGIGGTVIKESLVTIDDSGNISTPANVDGRDVSVDGAKLDTIESGATADQTGAEIRTLLDAEADTNIFDDAAQSKLTGIEAGAEVNNISDPDAAELTGGGATTLHRHANEYQSVSDAAVSINSTTTFANKLTLNTTNLPAGTYLVEFSYGWNHDDNATDFEAQYQLNAVDMGEIHKQEPKDNSNDFGGTGSDQRYYVKRVFEVVLSGVNAITLDYRTDSAGINSAIWDALITLRRVA